MDLPSVSWWCLGMAQKRSGDWSKVEWKDEQWWEDRSGCSPRVKCLLFVTSFVYRLLQDFGSFAWCISKWSQNCTPWSRCRNILIVWKIPLKICAVLRYHPDIVGKSAENLEKFREIQDAYKTLSTKELKTEYDKTLSRPIRPEAKGTIVPGPYITLMLE